MTDKDDPFQSPRRQMVDRHLRARGIRDERVLEAMGRVPRERFLPPAMRPHAYEDRAIPLSHGQTISQPFIVAAMTEALLLEAGARVLEIGTGSGYQTAVLAEIAEEVWSVERVGALAEDARRILEELGYGNVRIRLGDGTLGWAEEAPFQGILVTAAAPSAPAPLKEQLDPDGGRLVIPVGTRELQELRVFVRNGTEITSRNLMGCRFVPLLGEEGWDEG